MSSDVVRVGILGCGNVGAALVQLIDAHATEITRRSGLRLEVAKVAVRNVARSRAVDLGDAVITHDAQAVVDDPDIDVVVEVIGGIEPARSLILDALRLGKPVVTANKELLANVGKDVFDAAEAAGVDLLFEASVAGGIPLLRPLRESLAGERIERVLGIVNGTTNFILTQMTESGASFADALAEAQSLGFAERDPTADIEGYDAAAKAAIIATIAFGARVVAGDVYREGISQVSTADIAAARELGYVIKLLAIADQVDGSVAVRVHPAMVPLAHPLAAQHHARPAAGHVGGADRLRLRRDPGSQLLDARERAQHHGVRRGQSQRPDAVHVAGPAQLQPGTQPVDLGVGAAHVDLAVVGDVGRPGGGIAVRRVVGHPPAVPLFEFGPGGRMVAVHRRAQDGTLGRRRRQECKRIGNGAHERNLSPSGS